MNLDTALGLIANQHRRKLLVALSKRNPQDGLPASDTAHAGELALDELRTSMVHNHLPRLRETDVIEVTDDGDGLHVTRGEKFSEIQPLVETLDTAADELPGAWPEAGNG